MKEDSVYIEHILEMIAKIEVYLADLDYDAFVKDELLQDGVIRKLEVIGEAANQVSESFRLAHAEVPWREMVSMRNKIIHDYFDVDLSVVWDTAKRSLPELRAMLMKVR